MTARLQQLNHWLSEIISTKDYQLELASGDASFRCYFRLTHNDETFIVMDAPPEREDCAAFIDVAERLLVANINVPRIIEKDLQQGFLLLSDLGDKQYLDALTEESVDGLRVNGLYQDAMQTLVRLQRADTKDLSPYDEKLLLQEMELFRHWLLEKHIGLNLTAEAQAMLDDVFKRLADEALTQPKVFVHRDYHSRNLMVGGSDHAGDPGVLDFQDAVCGPLSYDLVSLLKDCYIKWPGQQIRIWANSFFEQLANNYPEMDEKKFMRCFDLMGVQRHLKASGIFARLHHRDGKSGYLADIPRTLSYIVDLKEDYPELQGLIDLIQSQVLISMEEAE